MAGKCDNDHGDPRRSDEGELGRSDGGERPDGGERSDGGERLNELFSVLSSRRRRYVLYHLREERRSDLDAVATQVAAWEWDEPAEEIDDEVLDHVRHDLYHNHLPKLREAAFVDFDPRSKAIAYHEPPPLLDAVLGISAEIELIRQ